MAFQDIEGHAQQIARLKARIQQAKAAGVYLFCGPEGIGKKMVARAFAQAVNCEEAGLEGCGRCRSCVRIAQGIHPDVHSIDAANPAQPQSEPGENSRRKPPPETKEIRIEDIRFLQQEIVLRPYEARVKVFIVNDAHMLNPEASNAFLKTLEEPPKNSLIILITDKPRLLFKTIVSRCWIVKFSALPRAEFMRAVAARLKLEDAALRYLSLACEGRLGSALAAGGSDVLAEKNRVIDYFTLTPHASVEHSFIQDRDTLKASLQVLAGVCRDLYVFKAGAGTARLLHGDRSELLARLAGKISFSRLDQIAQTVQDALLFVEQNANTKLVLANVLAAFA